MLKKTILIILSVLTPFLAFAQGDVLTLEEAVSEVMAGNPDIQAAHYESLAAKARIPQAKALDDPMVGVEFYNVPINTADVTKGDDIDYKIEQKIPFPGKRFVWGKAARFDAEAVQQGSRGQIQDVLLDLKRTYYDLYRVERSLEVNRENQRIMGQFLGSTETAYATGKTDAAAPLKAQVELSKLKNEEILMNQERIMHMAHLKALLNRPSHHDLRLPSQLKWPQLKASLEEVEAMAFETKPEIRKLDAMAKRNRAKLTAAKQSLIPDFSFGFAYKQKPGNQQDVWAGEAMINLPIFFWGKNRGAIKEAKASLKATEAEQESTHLHTQHEIEQGYSAFKASEQLLASYQKGILPQAKINLEAAKTAYATNKIDFLTLIDAARTYKEMQMSFYENQAHLGMAFAELERLVGRKLEEL